MTTRPRTGMVPSVDHIDFVEPAPAAIATAQVPPVPVRRPWAPPSPRRTTFRNWKRLALRALGVPFAVQNVLLDERRWTVTVSSHVVEQAGERYREGNPAVIAGEVADAIANARLGRTAPHHSHRAWGSARLAWTEDGKKTYVVRRSRRAWIVITALPAEMGARA